jgi:hypothetical protein
MRPLPTLAFRSLVAALLLAASATSASAQVFDQPGLRPPGLYSNGTDLFRAVLHTAKIRPLTEAEFPWRGANEDTILIIVGPPSQGEHRDNWVTVAGQVLRGGGAVLMVSDAAWDIGAGLPGSPRLRIAGERVRATDPRELHDPAQENSPLLVPWQPVFLDRTPVGQIFRGLRRVVTEQPSYLIVGSYDGVVQHRVAEFPRSARFDPFVFPGGPRPDPDRQPDPDRPPDPSKNPFAVAGAGPDRTVRRPYRFLAMADHAVVLNRLIADPTTDNLELSRRVIGFLQDPGGANRTRCLFVEMGRVVDQFDTAYRYAIPPPPIPPLALPPFEKVQQMLVDKGNALIDRAEERDLFNTMALGPESRPDRRQRNLVALTQGLLVVGSVWAVWFVLRKVWRARQPGDQPRPPAFGGPPKPGPAGIFNRREQELLRRNNLYEPVRDLLRDFFITAGAPADAGHKPSRLVFEVTGGKPARLQKAIDELWRIAYGRPALVTVYQWQDLEPKFETVRRAFEDGVWRFEAAAAATERGEG